MLDAIARRDRGRRLYPDVTAAGGLGPAMREAAERTGYDFGPLPLGDDVARIETARGVVTVHLAADERLFTVSVHIPGFTWPIGSTSDLALLVDAVARWRDGTPYADVAARFAFLDLGEFVRTLEAGEPTAQQWSGLLSADFHRRQRSLLRRLHADEVLRTMFPTITHGAVRLRVDPLDGTSRQVLVEEAESGRYRVLRVGAAGVGWTEVAGDDLISCLRDALTGGVIPPECGGCGG
ncbi:hypothetical protein K7862_05165 [Streptomyces sp. PLK6-54]|uniref:Uncharacterized protein n=2 Tax=Actinacidiphila acidipaludis TaxID=2873382 RepID=A0ABS7Q1L2_9ACTN|nr:hypothetical protein [Streptomyces acidipaludis]